MGIRSEYNLRKNIKQRKCRKEDSFSRLPDEIILCQILSRLMPREAGKCCCLSRRWRNLWRQSITCRLIFFHELLESLGPMALVVGKKVKRQCFAKWINTMLDLPQHQPRINEFVVRFDLNSTSSGDINNWLNFAFRKGVGRLELNLTPFDMYMEKRNKYVFPGVERFSGCSGIGNLRDACFEHINIDGEAIEDMFSVCHSLERLTVKCSKTLICLDVCGESVRRLKHLEIIKCKNVEKISISASSLVSLKYVGSRRALRIGDVPSLSEACIGGDYCEAFLKSSDSYLNCVSQLKKLRLKMTCKVVEECVNYPLEYHGFLSLEQLEVKMEMIYNGLFLLWPTVLIKAAPALQRFVVKLKYDGGRLMKLDSKLRAKGIHVQQSDTLVVGRTPGLCREVRRKIMRASKELGSECRLKVVEIQRFVGNRSDLKLARHLLSMPFPSLEKIVLVTSRFAPIKNRYSPCAGELYRERSIERANLVTKWLPSPSTQFVVK